MCAKGDSVSYSFIDYLNTRVSHMFDKVQDLQTHTSCSWIINTEFPSDNDLVRSQYIHTAIVLSEEINDSIKNYSASQLESVGNKLKDIHHTHRQELTDDMILMLFRARLGFEYQLRRIKPIEAFDSPRSYIYLVNMQVFLTTKKFSELTLHEFLQQLDVFTKKLLNMYYCEEIEDLVMILFYLCSKFANEAYKGRKEINNSKYITTNNGYSMCNSIYLRDMETIFFELLPRIELIKKMKLQNIDVIRKKVSETVLSELINTAIKDVAGIYSELIDEKMRIHIYDYFMTDGELKRLINKEKLGFKKHSAYNALAEPGRLKILDYIHSCLYKLINEKSYMGSWIQRVGYTYSLDLQKNYFNPPQQSMNFFIRTFYVADPLEYLYSVLNVYSRILSIYGNDAVFKYFSLSPECNQNEIEKYKKNSMKHPYIIRMLNEPVIIWKGKFYITHTKLFFEAFFYWMDISNSIEDKEFDIKIMFSRFSETIREDLNKIEQKKKDESINTIITKSIMPKSYISLSYYDEPIFS